MYYILRDKAKRKLNNKKGFTLVEVIVVLVILAILIAIAVPALTGYIDKAAEKSAIADTKTIVTALQTISVESYGNGAVIYGTCNSETGVRIKGAYNQPGTLISTKTYRETVNELTGKNYTAANFANPTASKSVNTIVYDSNSKGTATLTRFTYVTDDGKLQILYEKNLTTGKATFTPKKL